MRAFIMVLLFMLTVSTISAEEPVPPTKAADSTQDNAAEPKIEMHTYHMVFLRRGPNWTADVTDEVKRIGEGHMEHMRIHADSGYLVLAGPFLEQGTTPGVLAGIQLYRVDSKETARVMAERDPAVKSGRFTYEILPWLGPKSLKY